MTGAAYDVFSNKSPQVDTRISQPMWRAQIARFQDPRLKDHGRACVSTQIWGMLHISFKSFLSFICQLEMI